MFQEKKTNDFSIVLFFIAIWAKKNNIQNKNLLHLRTISKNKNLSSHHIVRNDQGPALIIANGQECGQELLVQLLEWSPLILVLDSAIERVMKIDLKVDVLIGDFDRNFDADKYRETQFPIEIIHKPDQNKTDLEKAFDYLIERKIPAVNVVWATGKRSDHTIANITNIVQYRNLLKIVLLDDYSKIFLLPNKFEKWYTKNSIISLIPIGEVTEISTENLFYPLIKETLKIGYRNGNSNHVNEDGIVKIEYKEGDLLMMECFD